MYPAVRYSFDATLNLTLRGNVPVAAPEPGSNEGPARRPPLAVDVALAWRRERERQLRDLILNFRRGGLDDWHDYHTLSAIQIRVAFRVQSAVLCMFDTYNAIQELGAYDRENWKDAVSGMDQYLENIVNLWNPETGVNTPGDDEFRPLIGMISNSHRCLDIVHTLYFDFFYYLSQNVDIAKLFDALKVSCTLGRFNAPLD